MLNQNTSFLVLRYFIENLLLIVATGLVFDDFPISDAHFSVELIHTCRRVSENSQSVSWSVIFDNIVTIHQKYWELLALDPGPGPVRSTKHGIGLQKLFELFFINEPYSGWI